MDELRQLISSQFSGQSGIIYCFSQKDTEEVAAELRSRSIKASAYHANTVNRSGVHQDWTHNRIQVTIKDVTPVCSIGVRFTRIRHICDLEN